MHQSPPAIPVADVTTAFPPKLVPNIFIANLEETLTSPQNLQCLDDSYKYRRASLVAAPGPGHVNKSSLLVDLAGRLSRPKVEAAARECCILGFVLNHIGPFSAVSKITESRLRTDWPN